MDNSKGSYILRVLVSIDQLGNTIAGGNPDATISARTGYFANIKKTKLRYWWLCMEAIINFAFSPVDGPQHCLDSYEADKEEMHKEGSDKARCILGLFIIIACAPISIITRIWVLISPSSRYKPEHDSTT